MKRIIVTALAILLSVAYTFAQKQGTILYENTINIHKNLSPEQQALKAMIPETTTQNFQFIFNEKFGCFKSAPSQKPKGIMIQMGGGDSKTWFNFEKNVFRKYIELDNELFHSETKIEKITDAKPTGKTKSILNYKCEEYKSEDGAYSFWVTKELPSYISPLAPMFLEGAILAIENDMLSYKAVSISEDFDEKELKAVQSEEITAEQFQDLQEEKLSEMKAMRGKVIKN
ncbi:hypothetical protein [Marinifilum caeruleilacunae]|uniref:GLPGLI family protein n=1 Tax=Marinifilum caeruleilacunae TaxID=2499076 RepID=A0ABX1WR45_9BACT|nr:hypothetical protein [Marinifilum caeruleilacunae]NOU58445.1 hypothetical protein [Marinifilum caeruleilacunae]